MMPTVETAVADAQALLARLKSFCFPGGEDAARLIRAVRSTEQGQIRMSPEARWIPFTAEQTIEATRSSFCWDARLDPDKIASPTVTDAYENGHGRLAVKLVGIVPVKKIVGPDADRGELQRYLASIVYCPPILLNHSSLKWEATRPLTLRVHDASDDTGASIDIDISDEGCPLTYRADRPRLVGKQAILTPWCATSSEFREVEGLRVPRRLEVSWNLPEAAFTYFQAEITSFVAVR
jgi:uncharacterized protein DUF6920